MSGLPIYLFFMNGLVSKSQLLDKFSKIYCHLLDKKLFTTYLPFQSFPSYLKGFNYKCFSK